MDWWEFSYLVFEPKHCSCPTFYLWDTREDKWVKRDNCLFIVNPKYNEYLLQPRRLCVSLLQCLTHSCCPMLKWNWCVFAGRCSMFSQHGDKSALLICCSLQWRQRGTHCSLRFAISFAFRTWQVGQSHVRSVSVLQMWFFSSLGPDMGPDMDLLFFMLLFFLLCKASCWYDLLEMELLKMELPFD